ncbi:MAG: AmmeMemoRadiSam system protein A [Desulfobacterales bacterium]|nr:AmmeMemoRadiSam system protein A [Desulfobacterales bacterium]
MDKYSHEEKTFLLRTARAMIASSLLTDVSLPETSGKAFPLLLEKRGCFVTLHKKGVLRGCIGTIEAVKPLLSCVKDNALNAAFGDPRFPALTAAELPEIEVEISVLTPPEPLPFSDEQDLKKKLIPGVHGVILTHGRRSATFLPQVWEQLPEVESFLTHLCLKAGLPGKAWLDKETQIKIYQVEYFSE